MHDYIIKETVGPVNSIYLSPICCYTFVTHLSFVDLLLFILTVYTYGKNSNIKFFCNTYPVPHIVWSVNKIWRILQ